MSQDLWTSGVRTEGQPGLSDLQVDRKVSLEAQVLEGHIGARLSLQGGVLHVAVEDTWGANTPFRNKRLEAACNKARNIEMEFKKSGVSLTDCTAG